MQNILPKAGALALVLRPSRRPAPEAMAVPATSPFADFQARPVCLTNSPTVIGA